MVTLVIFWVIIVGVLGLAWKFEDYWTIKVDSDSIYIIIGGNENEQDSELE